MIPWSQKYPYTEASQINLDWCVARIQELTREVNSFTGIQAPAHPNAGDYLRFDGRNWIAAPLPVYDGS